MADGVLFKTGNEDVAIGTWYDEDIVYTDVGLTMACAVINFLPPFIFYVFMQSKFKEGMTLSGIKG